MWLVEEGRVLHRGPQPLPAFPTLGLEFPLVLKHRFGPFHTIPSKAGALVAVGAGGKRGAHSSPFLSSWEMSGSTTLATTPSSCHPIACPHLDPSILHTLLCPHSVSPDSQGWGSRTSVSAHSSFSPPHRPPSPWSGPESKGMFWSLGRMGGPSEEGGRGGGDSVLSVSEP